ncbi:MAG: bleomycin resistance protein [Solirubrobacterales bacterium]|nr:bleomycin resistance protein [Solirubrobacterales bacterium]
MFLGLRTVIYPTTDLDASKAWFTSLLGQEPYFDQPFYVGYEVGGYELGLNPNANVADGAVTYWGVPDADAAMAQLLAAGATEHSAVNEVGDGIRVGEVREVGGSVLGIIENPHFKLGAPPSGAGPGR